MKRKNKLGDIVFALALIAFFVTQLVGCGDAAPYPPDPVSEPSRDYGAYTPADTSVGTAVDAVNTEVDAMETSAVIDAPAKADASDIADIASIRKVCGKRANVERSITPCHWDSEGEHPYGVVYDYGKAYRPYIDDCNWSLVFDAEYYKAAFPMLAIQYHYDDGELLFHFQTVGIREGRQGNESFNVGAYMSNCGAELKDAFKDDYEGYYLYYMLHQDAEKSVNTVSRSDGAAVRTQYAFRPTKLQAQELKEINAYRKDVDSPSVELVSELCAFADYRAYLNAHDGYKAHDWARENWDSITAWFTSYDANKFAENTVTHNGSIKVAGETESRNYYDSKEHYEAMVRPVYRYAGVSNICNGTKTTGVSSQFDVYADVISGAFIN